MQKKNIIVTGYPKSGTTWASSLVAELVQCSLLGDWGFDHIEKTYKEGLERASQFSCYKSHETYPQLMEESPDRISKIIHIIRDPRDIVISGMHYFDFKSKPHSALKKVGLNSLGNSIFPISEEEKKKTMIETVLFGNKKLSKWLEVSWKDHYESFKNKMVLQIKYEDLLDNPLETGQEILKFVGIEVDVNHIKASIDNQSFQKKKKEIAGENEYFLKKLMRKGEHGYWKAEFSEKEKEKFRTYLEETPYS